MAIIKAYMTVNNVDVLEHSIKTIPKKIRLGILKSRADKEHTIKCCKLRPGGAGGHLAHAFREILYAAGMNGNQEVRYERDKRIKISPRGVYTLQDVLRS